MAYRDEATAARARLAVLELELAERHTSRRTLYALRSAVRGELQRLSHALVWYTNGALYGFNDFRERDDLAPSLPEEGPAPDAGRITASLVGLDEREAMARAEALTRALAVGDPSLERLRADVERLRDQCAQLRSLVEQYAAKYPDHQPPPGYAPSRKLALTVIGASLGGVAMVVLAYLLALVG